MKTTTIVAFVMLFLSCKKSNFAEMTFDSQTHDFGTIKQGKIVTFDFKFKNTGSKDLLISDAKGSCGCTIPEFPKNTIKPNNEGIIKVSFNSDGKIGEQKKQINIFANTKNRIEKLEITANINQ